MLLLMSLMCNLLACLSRYDLEVLVLILLRLFVRSLLRWAPLLIVLLICVCVLMLFFNIRTKMKSPFCRALLMVKVSSCLLIVGVLRVIVRVCRRICRGIFIVVFCLLVRCMRDVRLFRLRVVDFDPFWPR